MIARAPIPFVPVRGRALVALLLCFAPSLAAQSTVSGVADRTFYSGAVNLEVESAPGWTTIATLVSASDGEVSIPLDEPVRVSDPEYYELRRVDDDGGGPQERVVQFLILASGRGSSERGLPPYVPLPSIHSAAAELAGARLDVLAPAAFPAGRPVPIAVWVRDPAGARVGVQGDVRAAGFDGEDVRILRGVGSTLLAPRTAGETLVWRGQLASLESTKTISIDATDRFVAVSGDLPGVTTWAEDARIRVTSHISVPEGARLTIGAGAVVLLDAGVELRVDGTIVVDGSAERPVVLAPYSTSAPWGGLVVRGESARAELSHAMVTGTGADPDWFDNNSGSGSSHRDEQCALYLGGGASAEVDASAFVSLVGQMGHGEDADLLMRDTLVQRAITAGQYNRGRVQLERCALVEFPGADAPFEDEDNDGLYLTGGAHVLTDTLIGWALDDGVDAGSGAGGSVDVNGCWFESCYHEAMAWSEARVARVADTVAINCGQGVECGFDNPDVTVTRLFATANLVGARFGDNYDWDYDGFLRVSDSLLLHNLRDVWGRNWDDWSYRTQQMDITGNWLSEPNDRHPANVIWDPLLDRDRLLPFLTSAEGAVGVGIALRSPVTDEASVRRGVPVRLSTFSRSVVEVDWRATNDRGEVATGTAVFTPGETVRRLVPPASLLADALSITLRLVAARGGEITGLDEAIVAATVTLVARGSVWRYEDSATDLGIGWRQPGYDDGAWESGAAELGFGDDDEATVIAGGPSDARTPTVYFRHAFEVLDPSSIIALETGLLRDDGAVVYLNGIEVQRSNLPEGPIAFSTLAVSSESGDEEEEFHRASIDPALLVSGRNVLAVEVHQVNATSSDISFDFELVARVLASSGPAGEFRRGDANDDGSINISDAVRILLVLFAGETTDCRDALDVTDSGTLEITDAVRLLGYLFGAGEPPPAPSPGCGVDPSDDALDCGARRSC